LQSSARVFLLVQDFKNQTLFEKQSNLNQPIRLPENEKAAYRKLINDYTRNFSFPGVDGKLYKLSGRELFR
jgi:hypothetical protein